MINACFKSLHNTLSMQSLQIWVTRTFLVYTCTSTSPKSSSMSTSAPLGVHPPGQLCCTKVATELEPLSAPVPGCLQGNAEAASSLFAKAWNFSPLQGTLCLWHSCFQPSKPFFPSVPHHFFVSNYHCWAVTARILAFLAFFNRPRRGSSK